jgi:succinate dehydrogenase / fumarate reductase membrane anchor subunit
MSLQSPLAKVIGLGSAREGADHWWAQRVSSVALLILGSWFLVSLACLDSFSYQDVSAFLARPWNAILVILLVVTIGYHSKLGLQVVIEDYVAGKALKVTALILSSFFHVLVAFAAAYAVLMISTGTAA